MKKVVFLSIIFISIIFISGCSIKKAMELTDAEKFANEYAVSKENPFKYIDIDEVLDILENKSGIIFFGNSDCEWCVASADILTEALNYKNIKEAYYYNPKTIRDKNSKEYKKLVNLLKDYLEEDEEENPYLYLPDIYFVQNGKIIGHNNDAATMNGTVDEALTSKTKKELKNKYLELISKYNIRECTDDC